MPNLFFRTDIAPYRTDTYNALHKYLDCELYFYWEQERDQNLNMEIIHSQCNFTPNYLKGIRFGRNTRKFCTNIWKILRKNKPNVVIVPEFQILTIQVLLYRWLFRKKFKVISMCDDSYDMVANDNDFTKTHSKARKLIAPKVDDILLVDNRVVEWYQKNYNKGIWLPIIRDEKKEISLYEKALPLSQEYNNSFELAGKKVLLYVGRLAEVKNLHTLIKAIEKTTEDFVTVIVGKGSELNSLKAEAEKTDKKIIFAGHYQGQEIRAWYNVSDVFILPSIKEPFGAVTNEALIAGNYAIISKVAGSTCLVNEENGVLIDPYDHMDIAKKIDETMKKVPSKDTVIKQKESKMFITFDELINNIIKKIS